MMGHVLMPVNKPVNPFFEGVVRHSKWQFTYGGLETPVESYKAILIHWPEQLFDWREPSESELEWLAKRFSYWHHHVKIIYVLHNEVRHYGMSSHFERLYDMVLLNSDAIVHLGRYSLEKYKKKYVNKKHVYIPHPLYETSFEIYNKVFARKKLGIDLNRQVIVVPGEIRSMGERHMMMKAFKQLKQKDKLLIVPRMLYKKVDLNFPGRYVLKRFIDINKVLERYFNKIGNINFWMNNEYQDYKDLSLLISAADVVLIPRINTLNSGNVFLGLTYNKIVVGPDIGNISEVLSFFKLPVFNVKRSSSVAHALKKGVKLASDNFSYDDTMLEHYKSAVVAEKWDAFLEALICELPKK
ncbi:glycosyltransferase family protein [Aestuariibaculum lutulentum]|uniref:Glycosyltransferase n=1 Tax=Aestuariibaculum lutulentum TaxID=2920935 RepID=A0ABS9RE67_9FLAO|nr:hypothetical protein [Aestuariibaculum lutulentum]MCH4551244.1 hypothetical protein [Aestuariibaculum lutulentum]